MSRKVHWARSENVLIRSVLITAVVCVLMFSCTRRADRTAIQNESRPDAVNINTATAEELGKLPSIGPRTAALIVEFRTVNGPFRRPEHLMQIRGISEERFRELRPFIKTE